MLPCAVMFMVLRCSEEFCRHELGGSDTFPEMSFVCYTFGV